MICGKVSQVSVQLQSRLPVSWPVVRTSLHAEAIAAPCPTAMVGPGRSSSAQRKRNTGKATVLCVSEANSLVSVGSLRFGPAPVLAITPLSSRGVSGRGSLLGILFTRRRAGRSCPPERLRNWFQDYLQDPNPKLWV